jgi:hypothetical protein
MAVMNHQMSRSETTSRTGTTPSPLTAWRSYSRIMAALLGDYRNDIILPSYVKGDLGVARKKPRGQAPGA